MTRTEIYCAVSDKHKKYRLKFIRFVISNDGSYVKTKQYTKPNNVTDSRTATELFVHSNREVVTKPCANHAVEARGALHYARDSGNFGRKSNGKVLFGLFPPEHLGPRL